MQMRYLSAVALSAADTYVGSADEREISCPQTLVSAWCKC